MGHTFPPRHLVTLSDRAGLRHPPALPELVYPDSPALSVMTSFDSVWPVTTTPDVPIAQALEAMKGAGVRLLLVRDPDSGIVGVVSAGDLMGERPVRIAEELRIPRSEIRVHQVMTPRDAVRVLDLRSVRDARVGHILATLDALGRQHVLVVESEEATGAQTIVGLFSRTHILRRMSRQPWESIPAASSLADMVHPEG